MKKKILIIVISIIVITAATITAIVIFNKSNNQSQTDFINESSAETGYISEKIIGNIDTASLIVYEYADYTCWHCAEWNRTLKKLISEYDGKIAIVYRAYNLGYKNGEVATRAATAAQVQGYFEKYKDLLFNNQIEWAYANENELDSLLAGYFVEASGGKGDLTKFRNDLKSEAVKKRVDYEQKMGDEAGVNATPAFRIEGETVPSSNLITVVEEKLGR